MRSMSVRVPGGSEADRLRELRRVARAEPGGALLMDDRRDREPRLVHEIALDRVRELGAFARREGGGRADACDLTNAVLQPPRRLRVGERIVGEQRRAPHAAELRELLVESHTRKQRVSIHLGILTRCRVCALLHACVLIA